MPLKAKVIRLPKRSSAGETLSDSALLAALGTGDVAALGALYDRHADTLFRFLCRMPHVDEQEAEDLVQEAFLAARHAARSYRGDCAVRTWLMAIAGNLSKARARSRQRYRSALERVRLQALPTLVSSDAEAQLRQRQQIACVAAALAELPHDLQLAYVLCELEGVPGVEAARVLKTREGTLYRRLHDARKRLRAALEREGPC
jgi:RNA polymerase sigma-70 factor (ECF subfamily)